MDTHSKHCLPLRGSCDFMDRALFVSDSESWCHGEEECGMMKAEGLDHGEPPK